MLRSFGQFVGRMRGMATDFQRAMNDAAREADMGNMTELTDFKDSISGTLDFDEQADKAQSFLDTEAIEDEDENPEEVFSEESNGESEVQE